MWLLVCFTSGISAKCCGKTTFRIVVPKGMGDQVAEQIIAARDNARSVYMPLMQILTHRTCTYMMYLLLLSCHDYRSEPRVRADKCMKFTTYM